MVVMPEKYVQKVIDRLTYLSQPEHWHIVKAGTVDVYGVGKYMHPLVQWQSLDGVSKGSLEVYWDETFIWHDSPWERCKPEKFWIGMTTDEFFQAMAFRNKYFNIEFDEKYYMLSHNHYRTLYSTVSV